MIKINKDGLDQIKRNAKRMHGTHEVRLTELFTIAFMQQHTRFSSIEEMFEESPFAVDSAEAFKAIPASDLDSFVTAHTNFSGWDEMLMEATKEKIARDLFR